jgi:hypothetical protein
MQLLRRPGFQNGETSQGEGVSAGLTDLASREPANSLKPTPIFSLKSMPPVTARNAPAGTFGWMWAFVQALRYRANDDQAGNRSAAEPTAFGDHKG